MPTRFTVPLAQPPSVSRELEHGGRGTATTTNSMTDARGEPWAPTLSLHRGAALPPMSIPVGGCTRVDPAAMALRPPPRPE